MHSIKNYSIRVSSPSAGPEGGKDREILVDLVTSTQRDYLGERTEEEVLAEWTKKLVSLPLDGRLAGILHTENDSLADVVQSDATHILYGQDYFYEELLGLRFRISPFSFFQTNSLGAEVLYDTARGFVGDTKRQGGIRPIQRYRDHCTDTGACG